MATPPSTPARFSFAAGVRAAPPVVIDEISFVCSSFVLCCVTPVGGIVWNWPWSVQWTVRGAHYQRRWLDPTLVLQFTLWGVALVLMLLVRSRTQSRQNQE
jgi:hypothetical protein